MGCDHDWVEGNPGKKTIYLSRGNVRVHGHFPESEKRVVYSFGRVCRKCVEVEERTSEVQAGVSVGSSSQWREAKLKDAKKIAEKILKADCEKKRQADKEANEKRESEEESRRGVLYVMKKYDEK